MRVVRLTVSRVSFADTMSAMRSWLDNNGNRPVRFKTASDGDGIEIEVAFPDQALADAFQREFDHSKGAGQIAEAEREATTPLRWCAWCGETLSSDAIGDFCNETCRAEDDAASHY
jgi:hypothetical protein